MINLMTSPSSATLKKLPALLPKELLTAQAIKAPLLQNSFDSFKGKAPKFSADKPPTDKRVLRLSQQPQGTAPQTPTGTSIPTANPQQQSTSTPLEGIRRLPLTFSNNPNTEQLKLIQSILDKHPEFESEGTTATANNTWVPSTSRSLPSTTELLDLTGGMRQEDHRTTHVIRSYASEAVARNQVKMYFTTILHQSPPIPHEDGLGFTVISEGGGKHIIRIMDGNPSKLLYKTVPHVQSNLVRQTISALEALLLS